MATIALPATPTPGGAGGCAREREQELAAAIAGHRAARREIVARAHATRRCDDAVARQLEDALAGLRRLEGEFARFRANSRAQIDAARAENRRLAAALADALAAAAPSKPFEKELSVSRLEAAAKPQREGAPPTAPASTAAPRDRARGRKQNAAATAAPATAASATAAPATAAAPPLPTPAPSGAQTRARSAEPRWRRTFSRNRSAPPATGADSATTESTTETAEGAAPAQEASTASAAAATRGSGNANSAGLFKRNSFSFSLASRSSRSSDPTRSRPASGKWSMCF